MRISLKTASLSKVAIPWLVTMLALAGCQSIPQEHSLFTAKELDFNFEPHGIPETGDDQDGQYAEYSIEDTSIRFTESIFPEKGKRWTGLQRFLNHLHGHHKFDLWKGYGVDGGFPDTILSGLEISDSSASYLLPEDLFKDIGNPNVEHVRMRRKGNQLELAMCNSDGAGGHYVLYQVDLAKAKARRYVREVINDEFTKTHGWTAMMKIKGSKPKKRATVSKMTGTYELIQKFEDQATGEILSQNILKMVLREDGVAEGWDDDKREDDGKWIVKGGDVRLTDPDGEVICFKRQDNGDLIMFRLEKKNGEIQILPKDRPINWKKTK